MNKKYVVDLQEEERRILHQMIRAGKHSARKISWVRVLLKADDGWKDEEIAEAMDIACRRFSGYANASWRRDWTRRLAHTSTSRDLTCRDWMGSRKPG